MCPGVNDAEEMTRIVQKLHIFVKKKKGNYKLDAELSFLTLRNNRLIRYLSKKKKKSS